MRALLYRRPGGLFTLTRHPPIRRRVEGTRRDDLYVQPGDPIGRIDICEAFASALVGDLSQLQAFDGVEIDLTATVLRRAGRIDADDF